jgi:hypothetical protein
LGLALFASFISDLLIIIIFRNQKTAGQLLFVSLRLCLELRDPFPGFCQLMLGLLQRVIERRL